MSSNPVLDNTKMMLEVLNEDEINAVQGVAKAFIMNSPFMPKTEEELVKRIDDSIAEEDSGQLEDADSALNAVLAEIGL